MTPAPLTGGYSDCAGCSGADCGALGRAVASVSPTGALAREKGAALGDTGVCSGTIGCAADEHADADEHAATSNKP